MKKCLKFKRIYQMIFYLFIVLETISLVDCFITSNCCNVTDNIIYIINLLHIECLLKITKIFKFLHKINWCAISKELASFSSMIGLQAVCTAVIIFLYSKYSDGIHGIPSEYLIEQKIGKKMVATYRKISLALPIVSVFFNWIQWYPVAVVSAIFLYIIIVIYVFLISELMQRDKTSELIKQKIKLEMSDKQEVLKLYIHKEISYGYYKRLIGNKDEKQNERKILLQTKRQIYYDLKSETINLVFNESNLYELNFVIKNIYEELIDIEMDGTLKFIYMYDLVTNIIKISLRTRKDWNLTEINQIVNALDDKDDEFLNKDLYSILYFALICAVLDAGENEEYDYLWYTFFYIESKRNRNLSNKLFIYTLFFIELLRRRGKEFDIENPQNNFFDKRDKCYRENFKNFFFYDKTEILEKIKECIFALSIIEFDTEDNIKRCFNDVVFDFDIMNRINNLM